jgi:hypothetical protein
MGGLMRRTFLCKVAPEEQGEVSIYA